MIVAGARLHNRFARGYHRDHGYIAHHSGVELQTETVAGHGADWRYSEHGRSLPQCLELRIRRGFCLWQDVPGNDTANAGLPGFA